MSEEAVILSERSGPLMHRERRIRAGARSLVTPASKDAPTTLEQGVAADLRPPFGHSAMCAVRLANDRIITKNGVEISTRYPFDGRLELDPRELDATTARIRDVDPIVGMR